MPLEFDAATHTYTLDGRKLPGVTEILADVGALDARWYPESARQRGAAVHLACQYLLEGDLDIETLPASLAGYVRSFDRFLAESKIKVELFEKIVHGVNHAGRLDLVGQLNGVRVLIDEKSGAVEAWCKLQTAGYVQALEHCEGLKVDKRFGLKLHADGKIASLIGPYDDSSDFLYWDACVRVYHGKRNGWKPLPTHGLATKATPAAEPNVAPDTVATESVTSPDQQPLPEEIKVDPSAGERAVLCDAIRALLNERAPGRDLPAQRARANLLKRHFGNENWAKVMLRPPADLRQGIESLRADPRSSTMRPAGTG